MAKNVKTFYVLDIRLVGSRPAIWRKILVSSRTTLAKLHQIIQVVMGWDGYHLHQFEKDRQYYGRPEHDGPGCAEITDEAKVRIDQLLTRSGAKMRYEYDFGDGWEHDVKLVKILEDPTLVTPVCLDGARCCPPEDCGGIYGYAALLEQRTAGAGAGDDDGESDDDFLGILEDDFDPERFSLQEVNEGLARIGRG